MNVVINFPPTDLLASPFDLNCRREELRDIGALAEILQRTRSIHRDDFLMVNASC